MTTSEFAAPLRYTPAAMKSVQISYTLMVATAAIVILLIIAAIYPHPWLWGINWWTGLGTTRVLACVGTVAAIGGISCMLLRWASRIDNKPQELSNVSDLNRKWRMVVIVAAILVPLLGWSFRAQSFVLGDGFAVIANLKLAVPIIKGRNFGGSIVPFILYDILPGDKDTRAQLAYQLYSLGSGFLYVIVAAFVATTFWKSLRARVATLLVLLTCGNMLLFFGYSENYPLFQVFYLLACVLGYRYIRDQRPRDAIWFSVATLLSLISHIFAVTLLPAAISVFLPVIAKRLKWRWIPGQQASAIIAVLFSFFGALGMYLADNFARMSFLPIFANEFTADGYTLFSLRHLSDFLNLIFMLVPGGVLLLLLGRWKSKPESLFLLFVAVTALGLVFWVNPWLGMPRDWDLLSIWMIPFTLWVLSNFLSETSRLSHWTICLCIALNATLLVPRIVANTSTAVMWDHFERYFANDATRNMKFRITQVTLLREQGFDERAEAVEREVSSQFPEVEMTRNAQLLSSRGRNDLAVQQCQLAISRNPMFSDAYSNLAVAQIGLGQYADAQRNLDIATAFNPYSPDMFNNLAVLAYAQNNFVEAEEFFIKSLSYNPDNVIARINLLHVAFSLRDPTRAAKYAQWLRGRTDMPPQETVGTVTNLVKLGLTDLAKEFLQDALKNNMDTSGARMLIERYPALK